MRSQSESCKGVSGKRERVEISSTDLRSSTEVNNAVDAR